MTASYFEPGSLAAPVEHGPLAWHALGAVELLPLPAFVLEVIDRHEPVGYRCVFANRALRELVDPEASALEPDECLSNGSVALASRYLEAAIADNTRVVFEDRLTFPGRVFEMSVAPILDRNERCVQLIGTARDVTDRAELASVLEFQMTHDALTGLPNRSVLLARIGEALEYADDRGSQVALVVIDLDHFKVVNDSLGHTIGDELLVTIARRIERILRFGDTLARLGGDEFAVVCVDVADLDEAQAVAKRIADALDAPLALDSGDVFLHASIGIAFATGSDDCADRLLRDADAALSVAKVSGRGRVEVFDDAMRAAAIERLDLEKDLHRALRDDEFRVFYQPLVQFEGSEVIGFEALLRWEHPERGLISPADFIPLAEETGLIVPIGAWVLDTVCRQAARWRASLPAAEPLVVSVNLSARQLAHPSLVATVAEAIGRSGIEPSMLELEVTETTLMDDPRVAITILQALRTLGVRIAIDDFGTGHSSLGYLKQLPVNCLKIDRSFVQGLGGVDPDDSAIVAAVVSMGHALGLDVTAEGIETPEQLAELEKLGCDVGQGFYFARPQPSDVVGALVHHRLRWQRHAQAG